MYYIFPYPLAGGTARAFRLVRSWSAVLLANGGASTLLAAGELVKNLISLEVNHTRSEGFSRVASLTEDVDVPGTTTEFQSNISILFLGVRVSLANDDVSIFHPISAT